MKTNQAPPVRDRYFGSSTYAPRHFGPSVTEPKYQGKLVYRCPLTNSPVNPKDVPAVIA